MPHFLDLEPLGPQAVRAILDEAKRRKAARAGRPRGMVDADAPLAGHELASIFEKSSTRTRLSMALAMRQLGGTVQTLSAGDMQLGRGETIEDTAKVLGRFADIISLRTDDHDKLIRMAETGGVPVINALTDETHPCQVIADIITVEEARGANVDGTIWTWLGDGNNVCHSIIEAAGLLGFTLRLSTPAAYDPDPRYVAAAEARGGRIEVIRNPEEAVSGADVIVTDTWVSMGDKDKNKRMVALSAYQVTEALMAKAASDAIFLHCLPAHRGEEVVEAVIDGPQSLVFEEAENRVHAQKAVMLYCLGRLNG
ncbi:ornithine carbamoyltransferase [Pacificimonas sp. WHA3]|uniref:Ornithine carbamoyltransferase n=1 Tax=Pacificimonas pallii TaxID=2827236 RepID=A0ABS6SHI8_9SPHN|nr:ornithine carbamoyltransferase [Pacificimonas pallii]MBV7257860.1 ornithine carbamoyltransferase [Pacificimonas pallii]